MERGKTIERMDPGAPWPGPLPILTVPATATIEPPCLAARLEKNGGRLRKRMEEEEGHWTTLSVKAWRQTT